MCYIIGMRIFAISDLHLSAEGDKPMQIFGRVWEDHWDKISADWDSKVEDGDVVLISGDISWAMRLEDAVKDLEVISKRKGKKVIIRGNHDYWWASISKIRAVIPPGISVIQNDAVRFDGLVVCGSRGWTVPESGGTGDAEDIKLYEREKLRMEMSLKAAEKLRQEGDKLIAMIHFPPFNSRFEDSHFTNLFRDYRVDAVVYGHLHGEACRAKPLHIKNGIRYYLTSCDKLSNELLEIAFGDL